ncbi:HisA/HisF family protein [Candidatus Bathyarchaeota archaeon]|nr:MAG: HisA/HisF family protein [Candidatus Bathyarchaeota archaeon]
MKIIPVLDVLNGVVVHAVGGKREKYYPIKSVLCKSSDPVNVALTFRSLGFDELYMADLDAILSNNANFSLYKRIKARADLNLMVDAGISDLEKAREVLENGVSKIIIGTETLENLAFVEEAVSLFGKNRVIISLDLKGGKIISKFPDIKSRSPLELAKTFQGMGVAQIIVLDLARVGMNKGINLGIVKEILEQTSVEVLTGGGVRDIKDLEKLRSMGVAGVLVATALHNGRLTIKKLKQASFI